MCEQITRDDIWNCNSDDMVDGLLYEQHIFDDFCENYMNYPGYVQRFQKKQLTALQQSLLDVIKDDIYRADTLSDDQIEIMAQVLETLTESRSDTFIKVCHYDDDALETLIYFHTVTPNDEFMKRLAMPKGDDKTILSIYYDE